jgi:PhoH-like ATPase
MFLQLSAAENPEIQAIARVFPDRTLAEINLAIDTVYGIQSRNVEQRMALELLMDPTVSIVTLVGQAGTGKTLLAIAAGLHLVLHEHLYDRILVSRPIVPLGKDIGYLPETRKRSCRTGWSRFSTTSSTFCASTSPTSLRREPRSSPAADPPRPHQPVAR